MVMSIIDQQYNSCISTNHVKRGISLGGLARRVLKGKMRVKGEKKEWIKQKGRLDGKGERMKEER